VLRCELWKRQAPSIHEGRPLLQHCKAQKYSNGGASLKTAILELYNVQDVARRIVKQATKLGASEAEALVYARDDTVVRFSQNNISQSAMYRDEGAMVRVFVAPSRRGIVFVKQLGDDEAIEKGIRRAISLASDVGERKNAVPFTAAGKIPRSNSNFKRQTETTTAEISEKAAKFAINTSLGVSALIKRVAGTITTRVANIAIQNSRGLDAYHKYPGASFVTVSLAKKENSTGVGFAAQASNNFADIDIRSTSKEAANDAIRSVKPQEINLGAYDVIFYPNAAFDWLGSFTQLGFSTQRMKGYVEAGKKCAAEKLTIVDDPTNPDTLMAIPFDAEGTPTSKLALVEDGIARALCFDNNSAAKAGVQSTAHSPFPNDLTYESKFFPAWIYFPANQIVKPGTTSFDDMISGSKKKTILVKRFMYGGLPMCVSETEIMQGYTMGTWLVEDGEIKHPLPSLRLSHSLSGLANSIVDIGDDESVKRLGCMNVPCMKVENVNFSVSTSMSVPQGVL